LYNGTHSATLEKAEILLGWLIALLGQRAKGFIWGLDSLIGAAGEGYIGMEMVLLNIPTPR